MICTFVWPTSPQYTGGVVAMFEFANGLARRGNEVHFIHGPRWPDRIDRIEQVTWFRFDDAIEHHIADDISDPALPAGQVAFTSAAPARLGMPVLFVQGSGMMSSATERDALRTPCPKVCVARWLVDVGLAYGVDPEQLLHVPLGIDHTMFRALTPLSHRPVDVAVLHNKHPAKGWDIAAQVLERVRAARPDLRVQIFGIAPPEQPIAEWMPFRCAPTHQELVEEVYNQARVFLQPSWYEGFGFSAVEAMASGCALVSTDNGGSSDYAIHGETAIVAPPGDVDALAAGVHTLLGDDAERARIAAAGERYVRRFDWDRAAEVLEGHLERYVADPDRFRRPPRPLDTLGPPPGAPLIP